MAFLLKDLIGSLMRMFTAPYFENVDLNSLNFGLTQGNATLSKLRLKRGALDKFHLPVDVKEGFLGELRLKIPWRNLSAQPCEVYLENLYILVVPAASGKYDPKEEEERAQSVKQDRLESAELLQLRGSLQLLKSDAAQQGFMASLTSKIINNLQITVKNIHVRYEDSLSNPGHPFAAGVTLEGFTVHSTDGDWKRAFTQSTKQVVYKLAQLTSMAVYFNTDTESLAGLSVDEALKKFTSLIATCDHTPDHQFLVKPISAEGKITVNPHITSEIPHIDVNVSLKEIGLVVNDEQYRDVISTVDMFHFFVRHNQYRKLRDFTAESNNRPRALLLFAGRAILAEIHDKNKRWSWAWFAQRRDERCKYVDLFKKSKVSTLAPSEATELATLERNLVYEDIRFYRSIARSQIRKDNAARKSMEERRKREQPQGGGGWLAWAWGSGGSNTAQSQDQSLDTLDEDKKQELYQAVEYDEKSAVTASLETQRDTLKMRISAELDKGTFDLRSEPNGANNEVLSVVFSNFSASFLQRPDNFEARVGLDGFSVYDGTTRDTPYHQIVRVKDEHSRAMSTSPGTDIDANEGHANRFFFAKYEQNPLDERADGGLTVRMRYMEIIYHKEFVEAIVKFFKPPASQLESVEALLDAASETLEGLRKETRAGLEYALQTHKTIDIKLDMQAPIIIIPEKITTTQCLHLLIDAGHISVKSNLADKSARQALQHKRSQAYTDDDLRSLENLMYDKFVLNLNAAQFVIGNGLDASLAALREDTPAAQSLHILERINIDLEVSKSIVPSAVYLAKMRVAGHLPTLKVNFSDAKYKSIMRFIDVAIPNLGDDPAPGVGAVRPPLRPGGGESKSNTRFRLPSVFRSQAEYNVEDAQDEDDEGEKDDGDEFFEASDGVAADIHQHAFEINFKVDKLQATMAKVGRDGSERVLGDIVLQDFDFGFVLRRFDMKVDVGLRSLAVNSFSAKGEPMALLTSKDVDVKEERQLMLVKYKRVQKISPEYLTVFEGIDQSIDAALSTFVLHAEPEPVITLFNFVMTTFVPANNGPQQPTPATTPSTEIKQELKEQIVLPGPRPAAEPEPPSDKISVHAKLDSFQVILENVGVRLATLSLSAADVTVLVAGPELRVAARLQDISLTDDTNTSTSDPEASQLLSIEGDEVANLVYETYDVAKQPTENRVNSSVSFHVGALKFRFVEAPLHGIYSFLIKLARLKSLYDAAAQAAVQRASEIEVQKMKLDVSVQSPVIYVPWAERDSRDLLVIRLGAIKAENTFTANENQMTASLRGIQVASTFIHNSQPSNLKLVDDINITAEIFQPLKVDRAVNTSLPDTRVSVNLSDIKLALTQTQYQLLMSMAQAVPRVFAVDGAAEASVPSTPAVVPSPPVEPAAIDSRPSTDLQPEIVVSWDAGKLIWTSLDVEVIVRSIKLQLYDAHATDEASLKNSGIARFALNDNAVRLKMLSDGAMEAEVVLKSFTMGNTFPGASRFREIIPAAKHDRNQFMILYTASGGADKSQLAVINIDSPHIIFAVDPVFALMHFFTSATQASTLQIAEDEIPELAEAPPPVSQGPGIDFRIDIHDASIIVLESDAESDTQAIELSIQQVALSQQGVLAMNVNKLGMSLFQMNAPHDKVSFIDDFSITLSMDNRKVAQHQLTSIQVQVEPVILRASYRDINLIMSIVNKAITLSTSSDAGKSPSSLALSDTASPKPTTTKSFKRPLASAVFTGPHAPQLILTKEELNADFGGFRLILIGDAHEMPVLDLKTKQFQAKAKDWSGELSAAIAISTDIKYYNFTNSYWEPFMEQWPFVVSVTKGSPNGAMTVTLSSKERLELNICATAVELALAAVNSLTKETDRAKKERGGDKPYRIANNTGHPVRIWTDGQTDTSQTLQDGKTADWAFDDWRAAREHVSSVGRHNRLSIEIEGKPWEALQGIPVDREGQKAITLRPKIDQLGTRLMCDITVDNNVKVVTLRSGFKIENKTLYPIEISLGMETQPYMVKKLPPNHDFSLPLTSETHNIRIRPDAGFGYRFSHAFDWQTLIKQPVQSIACQHESTASRSAAPAKGQEPPFHFHASASYDITDPNARKYPRLTLRLFSPLEVENLLPYDIDYLVFDKNTNLSWGTFLRRGGRMPVHFTQLSHLVLLNVKIQDPAYKQSEFAIVNTDRSSDFEVERKINIQDSQGRSLSLRLNYVRFPDAGGAFKAQIYSPFVLLNKTGLPLTVRPGKGPATKEIAGAPAASDHENVKPILLSSPSTRKDSDFSFKLPATSWSKSVHFEAPSAENELVIPVAGGSASSNMNVGVSWKEGEGKYKLSKVITITPRYIIKNALPDAVMFREKSVELQDENVLQPGLRKSFFTFKNYNQHLLTFAYPGLNSTWSSAIAIKNLGSVHIRMGDRANEHLLRVDVQTEGATVFVTLNRETDRWPFVIENRSDYTIKYCQVDDDHEGPTLSDWRHAKYPEVYVLNPRSSMDYAWDNPASVDKAIMLYANGRVRKVDIMEIGALLPFEFPLEFPTPAAASSIPNRRNKMTAASLDVKADGKRQILTISPYRAETSMYRPRRSAMGTLSRSDTLTSVDGFEAVTQDSTPTFIFKVDFSGFGLSLMNKNLLEVVYLSVKGLDVEYILTETSHGIGLKCQTIQLDNQLQEALYPVILQPTPLQRNSTQTSAPPVVQISLIVLKDQAHGVTFIKYASVLLQALTVQTDEDFLFALLDLSKLKGASWEHEQDTVLIQDAGDIVEPSGPPKDAMELYFEVLELQPIQLSISFMRTDRVNSEDRHVVLITTNPLSFLVNAVTMVVGNINDASLKMNALAIKDMRVTVPELQTRLITHYKDEVLRQLYMILLSADFLGNPVGLFTNVSSGVKDVFYEPIHGVIHTNADLGVGFAKGAASLVKKTVFGLSDTVTKVTGSIGKGLSVATLDQEFQDRRRLNQRRNKPGHLIYGVTAGVEALGTSLGSAASGVFTKPFEAAETQGAAGFFKGLGQGVVGLVTKPAVGVFDLAANVSEGVRNTTTVFDNPKLNRARYPRLVPANGVLVPYSHREALGQSWMRDLEQGKYKKEMYVAHVVLVDGDNIALLTTTRVLSFSSRRLRLNWDLPFANVTAVNIENAGITFKDRNGPGADKFLPIAEASAKDWFFEQIARVVKDFNLKRREDR
ncbi:vacuolar protein sorting-associated protein vps13 [Auriculariales sp. MPI-PUGE-AT-0066]|nr:vacuolar protein sorting-associated protein vps13 [Auriculariales sp. MPI-PUGE-AT-0066]